MRDAVQGQRGKDIDLTFITDAQGLRRIEAYAREQRWLCRVKAEDYIHFGVEEDADKRDVEGKIVQNFYVSPKVGTWGGGEWACNSMFYSLEHHVIVDLMGGQCKLDAEEKVLRIPFYQFLAEEEG